MAYTSVIPVRRLDRAVKYVMNKEKTMAVSLQDALDYAANRDKTEQSCFESSYACTLETAFADMRQTKERWHKSGGVQGYHLVQSFAAGEVSPELAHQIAKELADRVLGGRYEYVIGTHLNTGHMKKRYILFGYQIQNGEFCIVQQEGAAVEYIFDAYSNGDSLQQIATHMSSCGPPYRSSDNRWNKNIIARLLSCDIYCGTATYPAIITKELYFQVQQLRNEKSVSYSSVLQSFRDDMQCCCGERLYWYPKTHQWYCRHCGMWSNRIRPEELSQQLREKLFWICRHNERICSPQGASNIHSIESSRLSHEINTLLASPEPDAESIVRKILHRAELQFTCCSAGDADPATLQIKRACNELEPTDTFPLKLYAEIVSNVILYRDTHIEIKLRNGQIL
jgi:hypothetical protein